MVKNNIQPVVFVFIDLFLKGVLKVGFFNIAPSIWAISTLPLSCLCRELMRIHKCLEVFSLKIIKREQISESRGQIMSANLKRGWSLKRREGMSIYALVREPSSHPLETTYIKYPGVFIVIQEQIICLLSQCDAQNLQ